MADSVPCPNCGYPIPAAPDARCPECGRATDALVHRSDLAHIAGWAVRLIGAGMLAQFAGLDAIAAGAAGAGIVAILLAGFGSAWFRRAIWALAAWLAASILARTNPGFSEDSGLAFLNSAAGRFQDWTPLVTPLAIVLCFFVMAREGLIEERLGVRRRVLIVVLALAGLGTLGRVSGWWCNDWALSYMSTPAGQRTNESGYRAYRECGRWAEYLADLSTAAQLVGAGVVMQMFAVRRPPR